MCGVIGVMYERERRDLGRIAAELLRTLEYRGYDSTGAAIQGPGPEYVLRKGVGAPSTMVHTLGIVDLPGQILCGQVRWATFGAVTDANSQPHGVRCRPCIGEIGGPGLYGAHNGNVTNCDALKAWLTGEGHRVLSDNDGEMVVHTVEHYFARALGERPPEARLDVQVRRKAMREAFIAAASKLEGSYAAVIVDPISRCLFATKQGSSLYFGVGADETGGRFAIASSDLSSVLKLTRVVVPMREGEFMEFDATEHTLRAVRALAIPPEPGESGVRRYAAGEVIPRAPVRSRLRAKDTALVPPYETFMEQEIAAQEDNCRGVARMFLGDDGGAFALRRAFDAQPERVMTEVSERLDALRDEFDDGRIRAGFYALADSGSLRELLSSIPEALAATLTGDEGGRGDRVGDRLRSSEAGFLADLVPMARDAVDELAVYVLDALLERQEHAEWSRAIGRFLDYASQSLARGGRLFAICCGSSYNAARAAALFWNEMAHADLCPLLPGEFRERVSNSLRDGDLVIAVSQSGETKDLIDVLNDVIASGLDIRRVSLVNNVNSTIGVEKSDLVIPLRCGPEVAVPATKSFMNQLAVFYGLALRLGERRLAEPRSRSPRSPESAAEPGSEDTAWAQSLERRAERLRDLPALLRATLESVSDGVEEAAQLLYLRSSVHLLAIRLTALAREGALKIREVVLNHAEGFEGSEFKHGPNTILGWNTIYGPRGVDALLRVTGETIDRLLAAAASAGLPSASTRRLVQAVTSSVYSHAPATFSLTDEERALFDEVVSAGGTGEELLRTLYADYPLLYLTGPDERDVNLTVSQINTHKIRGSQTIVIAEDHPALRAAAEKPPSDNRDYRAVFVPLPRTDDALMTVFTATVALQRLALRMSLLKMQYLDRLGIQNHGVHPDVPKNVSKSITVD